MDNTTPHTNPVVILTCKGNPHSPDITNIMSLGALLMLYQTHQDYMYPLVQDKLIFCTYEGYITQHAAQAVLTTNTSTKDILTLVNYFDEKYSRLPLPHHLQPLCEALFNRGLNTPELWDKNPFAREAIRKIFLPLPINKQPNDKATPST